MLLAVFTAAAAAAAAPDGPALGHRDFYPDASRPVGWRGDGNGAFPGADPVTEWRDGTPRQVTLTVRGAHGTREKPFHDLADNRARNIVWRTAIDGFGNAHPVIVGDRVITTADPYRLLCLDARTGRIIWERENSAFDLMGLPGEDAEALQAYCDMAYAARAPIAVACGNYTRLGGVTPGNRRRWAEGFGLALDVIRRMVTDNTYGTNAIPGFLRMREALALLDDIPEGGSGKPVSAIMVNFQWPLNIGSRNGGILAGWIADTYGLWPYVHWDGWTGWTFPTPVSDGRRVYAWMGQGQVVCYDLSGERLWGFHAAFPPRRGGDGNGLAHLPSPLLSGEVLVVQTIHALIGVQKEKGTILWRAPNAVQHYAVGTHKLLALDDGTPVIVCTSGKVVRVRDGRVLCTLDVSAATTGGWGGDSLVGSGHRVVLPAHKTGKLMAFDLLASGDDKAEARKAWELPGGCTGFTPVLHADTLYRFTKGDRNVVNIRTGDLLPDPVPFTIHLGGQSPILAGSFFICHEVGSAYGRERPDGRLVVRCEVLRLAQTGRCEPVDTLNLLDGSARPRMPRLARYNPAYEARNAYSPQGCAPGQFGFGGFAAAANRLFCRSVAHMICIGDPAVPYNWNPRSRPADVTARLEAAAARPTGAEADLSLLAGSPYRWEREQAALRLAAMPPARQTALVPQIAGQLASTNGSAARAAACALRRLDAGAARAAGPALADACRRAVEAREHHRAARLADTLAAVAPGAGAELLPALRAALTSGRPADLRLACRVARALGPAAEPLAPLLASALRHPDPLPAAEAAWTLERTGGLTPEVLTALGQALGRPETVVAEAALRAIETAGSESSPLTEVLARTATRNDPDLACRAMRLLQGLDPPRAAAAAPRILQALRTPHNGVAATAAVTLMTVAPGMEHELVEEIIRAFQAEPQRTAPGIVRALRRIAPALSPPSRTALVNALAAQVAVLDAERIKWAALALEPFGPGAREAIPALRKAGLDSLNPRYARRAIKAIDPRIDVNNLQPPMQTMEQDDIDLDLDL